MTRRVRIVRWQQGERQERGDTLAQEEPLEIRVDSESVAVTMRTPGDDLALAAGFLFTEAVISGREDILSIASPARNIVAVQLAPGVRLDLDRLRRNVYVSSSCGVCGKASAESVFQHCPTLPPGPLVSPEVLLSLPETLRAAQSAFEQTGGVHASARFSDRGELLDLKEDVGRHNALDKLIGAALLDPTSLVGGLLLVSGRASFELVQKAAMAGFGVMAAVGAPSSLAVETAERVGLTLVGFLKADRFNIYAGGGRIET
jgi:FdhD protein